MTAKTYTAKDIENALSGGDASGLAFPSKIYRSSDKTQVLDFVRREMIENDDVVKVVIEDDCSLVNLLTP